MREKNRKPIASIKKLPQFTTMNVIDGQAGLTSYSSLIFYSLTIDNILNIIVLLILAGVTIATLVGDNGILTEANKAVQTNEEAEEKERIGLAWQSLYMRKVADNDNEEITAEELENQLISDGVDEDIVSATGSGTITVTFTHPDGDNVYTVDQNGNIIGPIGDGEIVTPPDDPATSTITLDEAKDDGMLTNPDNKTVQVEDGTFILPGGFKVADGSADTVQDGIVITDGTSEFVWVPVPDVVWDETTEIEYDSTEGKAYTPIAKTLKNDDGTVSTDDNGNTNYEGILYNFTGSTSASQRSGTGIGTIRNREPDVLSDTYDNSATNLSKVVGESYATMDDLKKDLQEEFNAMIESLKVNHGFYVGRYELSLSEETTGSAQSKVNAIALRADTNNISWYGLYGYAKTYSNPNSVNSVQSGMIWGSQYDAMMIWMQKNGIDVTSSSVHGGGTKNTSSTTTGLPNSTDVINEIYDLYGGGYEWTAEANNTKNRVYRGGYSYDSGSPSARINYYPTYTSSYYSSRTALYIR